MLLLNRNQLMPSFILFSSSFLFFLLPAVAFGATHNPQHLKNVFVVGGTHGNEYTGVWVIKALKRAKAKVDEEYPSLNINTLLGNPEAHIQNKRFVDEDLNRQFSHELLTKDVGKDDQDLPHETILAREIDQLIGPKYPKDKCYGDTLQMRRLMTHQLASTRRAVASKTLASRFMSSAMASMLKSTRRAVASKTCQTSPCQRLHNLCCASARRRCLKEHAGLQHVCMPGSTRDLADLVVEATRLAAHPALRPVKTYRARFSMPPLTRRL